MKILETWICNVGFKYVGISECEAKRTSAKCSRMTLYSPLVATVNYLKNCNSGPFCPALAYEIAEAHHVCIYINSSNTVHIFHCESPPGMIVEEYHHHHFFFFVFFFSAFFPASPAPSTDSAGISRSGVFFGTSILRERSGKTLRAGAGFGVRNSNSIFRLLWFADSAFFLIRRRYMFWFPSVMWSLCTSWEAAGSPNWGWIVIVRCWSLESFPFFAAPSCQQFFLINQISLKWIFI